MAARTKGCPATLSARARLGALIAIVIGATAGAAAAQPASDAEILGTDDDGWKLEDLALRGVYFDQDGHGYQSQAGPPGGPGSEATWIVEPWAQVTVRQSKTIRHELTIPVDIVSAASPDALDAVSSASRRNEAVAGDLRTTFTTSDTDSITTRVAFHWEEPLSSGTVGVGWRRSLADDNAAVAVNGSVTIDGFDIDDQNGDYREKGARSTTSVNLSVSQILSPTTVVDATYGGTWQHGTLAQTWNAVPVEGMDPAGEVLPRNRLRHAIAGRIAQHIPATRSTVKAWYRYYRDDFGLSAHTVELTGYQYLVPWLYLRAAYRFHHQTGVDFYTEEMATMPSGGTARTADSDLAPFDAHELDVGLAIVGDRAPKVLKRIGLVLDYTHYHRTNDLTIDVFALGVSRSF